jgi:hypothetical protein
VNFTLVKGDLLMYKEEACNRSGNYDRFGKRVQD